MGKWIDTGGREFGDLKEAGVIKAGIQLQILGGDGPEPPVLVGDVNDANGSCDCCVGVDPHAVVVRYRDLLDEPAEKHVRVTDIHRGRGEGRDAVYCKLRDPTNGELEIGARLDYALEEAQKRGWTVDNLAEALRTAMGA